MSSVRKAHLPMILNVDFGCSRRCQADFDLEGVHVRFTLGQMLAKIERAHDEAHAAEPPVRVFTWTDDVVIRTRLIPPAASHA